MAGIIRLNELPEGSGSLSNDDIFVFMDDPSGGGVTKKISLSQIGTAILANDSRWDYFLPSAPSGVSGVEGDRSVSLTWTSSGEPVETLPVTDYVIQYSSDNGTTWTTFADVVSPSTSVVVDNLVNNTNYKFRVRAVNGIGLGAYSSMSSTLTPEMPKPSGVTGSGADGAVLLNWSAPSPSPIDGITDYLIQYSSDNGATWTTFNDGIGISTSATVTGLTNGTGYKFRVAVVNNVETSEYSTPSDTVTPNPPVSAYLLMHFDGDLSDSSANDFTATASGDATVSTAQSKFGGSSLYLDGSGDYLTVPADAGALGTDDFTVEYWCKSPGASNSQHLATLGTLSLGATAYSWRLSPGTSSYPGLWFAYNDGTNYHDVAIGSQDICDNQWHHIALTRSGETVRGFVDGALAGSLTYGGSLSSGGDLYIGGQLLDNAFYGGYIDELRIVQGTAVYTDTFTPPTGPF